MKRTRSTAQRDMMSVIGLIVSLFAALAFATPARAQDVRIRDLTVEDRAVPVRLMGYGLVVGLDNTGDRVMGGKQGGMTVNSVVNLLRRFDIEVPAEVVRMRNVAAVLVTAEVSPYMRAGGSFEVHVSSVGDARSLRGGVLWMTPLLSDVGGKPMGSAQGALLTTDLSSGMNHTMALAENSARIPTGGLLEADLPHPKFATLARLVLRDPDVGTASRIASAINKEMGDSTAHVEDPGSVALTFKANEKLDRATLISRIGDVRVRPERASRIIIDGRDGTVVAGGDIGISDAVVTHAGITLSVGAPSAADSLVRRDTSVTGGLHVNTGTPAYRVAAALHAMKAAPSDIAAIFEALRSVGALSAEVVIR